MEAKLLDGAALAQQIRAEIAVDVAHLKAAHGVTPGLAVVLVGDDPASAVYVRNKQKAAAEAGMVAEDHKMPAETSQAELMRKIEELSANDSVHGMLVQIPLPSHLDEVSAIDALDPAKDVDGLHPENAGRLVAGRPRFIPATPAGIQQILVRNGHDPSGKHVVVCGRSEIVGKPVSVLLVQKQDGANATVTICHSRTRDLPEVTRQADILIAAIGQPQFVTANMVKEGVVVVDVGVNRVDDPSKKAGYRLIGDVDYDAVKEKTSAITPVPGGVGPMTITMLLYNTIWSAKRTKSIA